MNGEFLNHAGQWAAILIGGAGLWATLRRMRTNEIAHLEAELRAECKAIHEEIGKVWSVVGETRDRVSRLEGRMNSG